MTTEDMIKTLLLMKCRDCDKRLGLVESPDGKAINFGGDGYIRCWPCVVVLGEGKDVLQIENFDHLRVLEDLVIEASVQGVDVYDLDGSGDGDQKAWVKTKLWESLPQNMTDLLKQSCVFTKLYGEKK